MIHPGITHPLTPHVSVGPLLPPLTRCSLFSHDCAEEICYGEISQGSQSCQNQEPTPIQNPLPNHPGNPQGTPGSKTSIPTQKPYPHRHRNPKDQGILIKDDKYSQIRTCLAQDHVTTYSVSSVPGMRSRDQLRSGPGGLGTSPIVR